MDSREKLRECLHLTLKTDHEQIVNELVCRSDIVYAAKGTRLFREGEPIRECYFLLSGVVRMFYSDSDGTEITERISFEPGTILHPSYRLRDVSTAESSGEAATDCELAHIPMSALMEVVHLYPEFDGIRVRLLQDTLEQQNELKRNLTHKTPSERYEWFVENCPQVTERIPQKYIASFLGMTPVSLSRIRGRYKARNEEA